jgi:ATP-dependent Clp protease adaptor protein ClpS
VEPVPPAFPSLTTAPVKEPEVVPAQTLEPAVPWITLVWNDPVNLMSYVTYVFQSYFGYSRQKAERLMMDVHTKGKAVVSHGTREEMERDTLAMQGYGLWATFERDQ